jgi:hypothetical protein
MKKYFLLWLIVWLLGFVINIGDLNRMPKGVHAWAQADRLSLSMNFLDENNILKPATHCLFTKDGRVGCEFPLLPYIAAKVTTAFFLPEHLPLVFRAICWAFFSLGFVFFILILRDYFHIKELHAFLLGVLLIPSPVMLFYGYSFLNDVPAFGVLMVSFYFFLHWCRETFSNKKAIYNLTMALGFAALAAVMKGSALVYFISMGAVTLFFFIKQFRLIFKHVGIWTLLFACFLFVFLFYYYNYFYYVKFNIENYTYVFLSNVEPLKFPRDLKHIFYIPRKWHFEWLSIPQWAIIILGLIYFWKKDKSATHSFLNIPILLWIILLITGLSILFVIIGYQLLDHDYYFIVITLPCLLLLSATGIGKFYQTRFSNHTFWLIVLILSGIVSLFITIEKANNRLQEVYHVYHDSIVNETEWMENGDKILDSLGIRKDAHFLILYEHSVNIHLTYFNRKGLIYSTHDMQNHTKHDIEDWLEWRNFEYYIIRNHNLKQLKQDQPWLYESSELLFENQDYQVRKITIEPNQ